MCAPMALSISDFPHETTLDQWFGESQFESYRRLGEYLMCKLYEEQLPKMKLASRARPGRWISFLR